MWNRNERSGNLDQAKGRVKQAVGSLTGNKKLKASGTIDENVGKAKAAIGGAERKVRVALANVKKAAKG
jgi:uncharacterized protein YjbJ (UPF0337 family)